MFILRHSGCFGISVKNTLKQNLFSYFKMIKSKKSLVSELVRAVSINMPTVKFFFDCAFVRRDVVHLLL